MEITVGDITEILGNYFNVDEKTLVLCACEIMGAFSQKRIEDNHMPDGFEEWRNNFCKTIIQWTDWRLNQITNPAEAGEFLMDELENLKTLAEANIK